MRRATVFLSVLFALGLVSAYAVAGSTVTHEYVRPGTTVVIPAQTFTDSYTLPDPVTVTETLPAQTVTVTVTDTGTTTTTPDPPPAPTLTKGLATGFRFAPSTTNVVRAKAAGAAVFREEFNGTTVGPGTNADALCDAALANGLKWQILILESQLTNTSLVSQAAARYGPGGPKPCADVLELGNEPYWSGQSATTYGTNARNAANAAHAANPAIKVTVAIGPPGLSWIDGLNSSGALAVADFFTHHPYSNRSAKYGDPTVWDANASDWELSWQRFRKYRDKLVTLGFDQPFLLTETGWQTCGRYGSGDPLWSEAQQADFIGKAFTLAKSLPWVSGLFVFALDDNPAATNCTASSSPEQNYGILRAGGAQKASYAVFRDA